MEAVHAYLPAVNFFGVVQRFVLLFSASPKRWQILSKVEAVHTLKPLSDTRWAAQINAVRAIYLNFSVILEALCELKILVQTSGDYVALSECNSLNKCINFEFCLALCFWHNLLSQFDRVTISIQSPETDIQKSLKLLEALSKFLQDFRDIGFEQIFEQVKSLSEVNDISIKLAVKRVRRQTRQPGDKHQISQLTIPKQN